MPYDTEVMAETAKAETRAALRRAKQVIRERGHVKHQPTDETGAVCAYAALSLGASGNIWGNPSPAHAAVTDQIVREYPHFSNRTTPICSWNNLPETRVEDVIALFDRTIAALDA